MFRKTVFVLLLVAVAAAEGRDKGFKVGRRTSKQFAIWGRPREETTQAPAGGAAYPQTQIGPEYPPPPQSGNTGYTPIAPGPAPGGYSPPTSGSSSPVDQSSYHSQPSVGYQQGPASQTPQVVSGIPPISSSICRYPGFFATPGSCVNFYRCVDWYGTGTSYTVFQFNCPLGTIFDDDLDVCSHIAWVVPRRPECIDMLSSSLVPEGSGSPSQSTGTGSYVPPSGTGVYPQPPVVYPPQGGPAVTYPPQVTVGLPSAGTYPPATGNAPPKPFALVCYSENAYHRHPLYCNRYYQCSWNGADWVFPMQTCPEGLAFNEAAQSCADPASIAPCDGELAPSPTPEVLETEAPTESPITQPPTGQQGPAIDPSSLYACPSTGYYPFEYDCIRFYKCVELESGALRGLLYKCPDGYGYSEEKKRCDKNERLPTCAKVAAPGHLRHAPATPLYPDDLLWFFNSK